jgi:hypothetical protein
LSTAVYLFVRGFTNLKDAFELERRARDTESEALLVAHGFTQKQL